MHKPGLHCWSNTHQTHLLSHKRAHEQCPFSEVKKLNTSVFCIVSVFHYWSHSHIDSRWNTHPEQTVHTWPPSCSVQTQPQIPVLPSLSESYTLPMLQLQPQVPKWMKYIWIKLFNHVIHLGMLIRRGGHSISKNRSCISLSLTDAKFCWRITKRF